MNASSTTFANIVFDRLNGAGNSTILLASTLALSGNAIFQNSNSSSGSLSVTSSNTTTRTVTVAGSLLMPSTAGTAAMSISDSIDSAKISFALSGDLIMSDSSATLYGDVTFAGTGLQTVNRSAGTVNASFSDWTVSKASGSVILATSAVPHGLTISQGVFNINNTAFTASTTVGSLGTYALNGGESVTTPTLLASSTVLYTGTSTSYTLKNYSYKNLSISGGGSSTFTLPASLTVAGDFSIAASTVDASSTGNFALSVSGNWSNTGTFTPRLGTVTLNGTDQTLSGSTNFYNLTKNATSTTSTLTLPAGATQTVSNTLTLAGASGHLLSVRSSTPGTRAKINPQGTRSLTYLDVKDNENTNAAAIAMDASFVDSGNNLNWGFDSTAPVVSSIIVTPATTTASITFSTDEAAYDQVYYGISSSPYASSTVQSGAASTTHSVSLTGLSPSTVYHYAITTTDTGGNAGTTTDATFTTSALPDIVPPSVSVTVPLSGATVSGSSYTLTATSSDNVGIAGVQFRLDTTTLIGAEGTSSPYSVSWNTAGAADGMHSIVAVARDAAGNYATSTSVTVTVDNAGPVISSVSSGSPTSASTTISWTTDEPATGQVEYGVSASYTASSTLVAATTTSHNIGISGLSPSTLYHYRAISVDSQGNRTNGTDGTFTTSAPADATPPAVSLTSPAGGYASSTAFSITATSSDAVGVAGVQFKYDTNNLIGAEDTGAPYAAFWNTSLVSDGPHTIVAVARDAAGNYATSSGVTVIVDNATPSISAVSSGTPGGTSATITWTTGESATGQVEYGTSSSFGSFSALVTATSTSHSIPLSGLLFSTLYCYRVLSRDDAGSLATSTGSTFTTASAPDTNPPTVSITAPLDGATVSASSVAFSATSIDDVAIAGVSFYRGTTVIGFEDTSSPYSVVWDSTAVADGSYALRAVARDTSNNYATSSPVTVTVDNTGPIISSVSSGTPGGTSATITWTTDEAATGQAEYGLSVYTASSTLVTATSTSHSINISSLSYATAYHYRVISVDSQGNRTNSGDGTFTTSSAPDATLPTVSLTAPSNGVTVSGSSVTVSATSSDNVAVAGVAFYSGTTAISAEDTGAPYSVSWDTTALADGSYSLIAVARDTSNNYATSSARTVTVDNTAPVRSSGSPSGTLPLGTSTTTVSLATDEAATCRYSTSAATAYGSMTPFTTTGGTAHFASVSGLSNSNSYSYYAKCSDGQGNVNATDYPISFNIGSDTTAPAISSISSGTPGASSATISWTTDEPATSQVEYGLSSSYGTASMLDASLATSHSVSLSGLSAATTYHYRVRSADAASNLATSTEQTFTTSVAADTTPPAISLGSPSGTLSSGTASATLSVSTDEASTCRYGTAPGIAYASLPNIFTTTGGTSHSAVLTGLSDSASYSYFVRCSDSSSNADLSDYAISFSVASPSVALAAEAAQPATGRGSHPLGLSVTPSVSAFAPSSGHGSPFSRDLTLNDTGADVLALQKFLNAHGFLISASGAGSLGKETDKFGAATRAALIRFQKSLGISATGNFGPLTRKAADAVLGATPAESVSVPAASSSVPAKAFLRDRSLGDAGPDVKLLQKFLNSHGFPIASSGSGSAGQETEKFGAATKAALARFQKSQGVSPSVGNFGPATRAAVSDILGY